MLELLSVLSMLVYTSPAVQQSKGSFRKGVTCSAKHFPIPKSISLRSRVDSLMMWQTILLGADDRMLELTAESMSWHIVFLELPRRTSSKWRSGRLRLGRKSSSFLFVETEMETQCQPCSWVVSVGDYANPHLSLELQDHLDS